MREALRLAVYQSACHDETTIYDGPRFGPSFFAEGVIMARRERKYIVGNWKMNQDLAGIRDFFTGLNQVKSQLHCHAWVASQFIHVPIMKDLAFTLGNITVGAQNCSSYEKGAYTGEVAAYALADMGVHFVLIGHSERRQYFAENNKELRKKMDLALASDLTVIYCVGETLEENQKGQTQEVLKKQIHEALEGMSEEKAKKMIIAYEPVWAIGTGKTATVEQAQSAHQLIRQELGLLWPKEGADTPILYGGSVNNNNVQELLSAPDIDGGLVGGASLKAKDFINLCLSASIFNR